MESTLTVIPAQAGIQLIKNPPQRGENIKNTF